MRPLRPRDGSGRLKVSPGRLNSNDDVSLRIGAFVEEGFVPLDYDVLYTLVSRLRNGEITNGWV